MDEMASEAARHFDHSMFLVEKNKIKEVLCFREMWFGLFPLLLHSLVNTLLPVTLGLGKVFQGMAQISLHPLGFSSFKSQPTTVLSLNSWLKCNLSWQWELEIYSSLNSSAHWFFLTIISPAWAELEPGTLDYDRDWGDQKEFLPDLTIFFYCAFFVFYCQQLLSFLRFSKLS